MRRAWSVLLLALLTAPAAAQEMAPFVIPQAPGEASPLAMPSSPIAANGPRLVAADGHFMVQGQRVRIWGVNICFGAAFPSHADAEMIAARMAAAGVNGVRFHHMDTGTYPRGILDPKDPMKPHPEALERLDYFLDQLARRGIYANLNLHVGRSASRLLKLPAPNTQYDKIVGIFTPALVEAQKQYARDLLTHTSAYRKVRYADDPAVAFVEITNEDSLFMWSARRDLRELPDYYAKVLQGRYVAWLKARYGSTASLRQAWALGAEPGRREGLQKDESLEAGNVALHAPGEVEVRAIDRLRFLTDTEKAYFDDMRAFVQKDLGAKALVTGTQVYGACGFYGQSGMDYVDSHAYWQHPRFPGRPWDPGNWLVEQKAMVDYPSQATLPRLAAQRMDGKPFTVSEYNHPAPNDFQAECVPMMAAWAAAHDWDGVWFFTYSHQEGTADRDRLNSYFDIDSNPAKWGFMRAGAAIFRQGAVPPLRRTIGLCICGGDDMIGELARLYLKHDLDMLGVVNERMPVTGEDLLRMGYKGALEGHSGVEDSQARVEPEIAWTVEAKKRGTFSAAGPGAAVLVTHAAGGRAVGPENRLAATKPAFAAVTMTALDGQPLEKSRSILITACGRCENTDMQFSADRRTVGRNWGRGPVLIEPVTGTVALPPGEWKCRALGPDGLPRADVPVAKDDKGRPMIALSPEYKTMWYLVTPAK